MCTASTPTTCALQFLTVAWQLLWQQNTNFSWTKSNTIQGDHFLNGPPKFNRLVEDPHQKIPLCTVKFKQNKITTPRDIRASSNGPIAVFADSQVKVVRPDPDGHEVCEHYHVQKVGKDGRSFTLERKWDHQVVTKPEFQPPGYQSGPQQVQVYVRERDLRDENDKGATKGDDARRKVYSGDMDEWDLTLLSWGLLNSAHKLVNSSEYKVLKDHLNMIRNVRNCEFGHRKNAQITWVDFWVALENMNVLAAEAETATGMPGIAANFQHRVEKALGRLSNADTSHEVSTYRSVADRNSWDDINYAAEFVTYDPFDGKEPCVTDDSRKCAVLFASGMGDAHLANVVNESEALGMVLTKCGCNVAKVPASLEALKQQLQGGAQILVFLCHGDMQLEGQFTLGLEDEQGFQLVKPETVVSLFEPYRETVQLVVISGCNSFALGDLLVRSGIQHVVCWETLLHDEAAGIFDARFLAHFIQQSSEPEYNLLKALETAMKAASAAVEGVLTSGRADTGHSAAVPKYRLGDPEEENPDQKVAIGIPCLLHRPDRLKFPSFPGPTVTQDDYIIRHVYKAIRKSVCSRSPRIVVHGSKASGKTVAAKWVGSDTRVQAHYPDGVVWVHAADRTVDALQSDIIRSLLALPAFANASELHMQASAIQPGDAAKSSRLIQELVGGIRCLIVLDGISEVAADAVDRIPVDYPSSLLLTTTDKRLGDRIGAQSHSVDELTEDEAFALLAQQAGQHVADVECNEAACLVAHACGRVVVAVRAAGAMARSSSWEDIWEQLRLEDLHAVHVHGNSYRTVDDVLALCVHSISDLALREHYLELGIFPSNVEVPIDVVERLWQCSTGQAKDWAQALHNKALLEWHNTDAVQAIWISSLHLTFLSDRLHESENEIALHQMLVESFCRECSLWCERVTFAGGTEPSCSMTIVNRTEKYVEVLVDGEELPCMLPVLCLRPIRHCAFCSRQKAANAMSKCSGCKQVWYCGKQCQAKHWKGASTGQSKHKDECSTMLGQQSEPEWSSGSKDRYFRQWLPYHVKMAKSEEHVGNHPAVGSKDLQLVQALGAAESWVLRWNAHHPDSVVRSHAIRTIGSLTDLDMAQRWSYVHLLKSVLKEDRLATNVLNAAERAHANLVPKVCKVPSDPWSWLELSVNLAQQGQCEAVDADFILQLCDAREIKETNRWEALNNVATIFRDQGRIEESLALYDRAVHAAQHGNSSQIAQCFSSYALLLDNTKQHEKAQVWHQQAIERDPEFAKAWSWYAYCLEKQGHFQDAESKYLQAIELNQTDAVTLHNLGLLYHGKLGQLEKAVRCYKRAMEADPLHERAPVTCVSALMEQQHVDEAASVCRQALRSNPGNLKCVLLYTQCTFAVGESGRPVHPAATCEVISEVLTLYKQAIGADPEKVTGEMLYECMGLLSRHLTICTRQEDAVSSLLEIAQVAIACGHGKFLVVVGNLLNYFKHPYGPELLGKVDHMSKQA